MITWVRVGARFGPVYVAYDDRNDVIGQVVKWGSKWMVNTHDGRRAGLEPCRSLREGKRRVEEVRA